MRLLPILDNFLWEHNGRSTPFLRAAWYSITEVHHGLFCQLSMMAIYILCSAITNKIAISFLKCVFMHPCKNVYGINSSKCNFWVNLYYSWIEFSMPPLFSFFLTRRSSISIVHLCYTVCGGQNQQGKCFIILYIFTLKSIGPLPLH